jgi:hypothetical protein
MLVIDVWFLAVVRNWIFIAHAELQDTSEECCLFGLNAPQIPHVAHFCADLVSVEVTVAFCNQYLNLMGSALKTSLIYCAVHQIIFDYVLMTVLDIIQDMVSSLYSCIGTHQFRDTPLIQNFIVPMKFLLCL